MKRSHLKPKLPLKGNTVNIAALKSQLARYLRLVKSGQEITVLDHKMPVAKLIPMPLDSRAPMDSIKPKASFASFMTLPVPPLEATPKIDILSILLKERGSR